MSGTFLPQSAQTLNRFVIWVSLPALVMHKMPGLELESGMLTPVIAAWMTQAGSVLLVWLVSRMLKLPRSVTGALMLVVPLGNTGFLGIPMTRVWYGPDNLLPALLYDQLGSFLGVSIYATMASAYYSGEQRPTALLLLRRIFTFPPFVALLIGLAMRGHQWPGPIAEVLELAENSMVPVVMFAVGLQLKLRLAKGRKRMLALGLGLKLLVVPALCLLYCLLFGWQGLPAQISVFQAGMPAMVTASVLAAEADLEPELAASLAGVGIVLSLVTLPMWHWITGVVLS